MCGIAGIYNLKQNNQKANNQKEIIRKMTNIMAHRGPDDAGFFVDKNIAFGHRRLAILDLSKSGHQPMEKDNYMIVFNGEIYNYIEIREGLTKKGYKFNTQTDTEVIVASYQEWGPKCLERFNGMWAFAIYNIKSQELFCARDRLGVKPFYYFFNKEQFIFASEAKALLTHPDIKAEVNEQSVWDYLICGYLDHQEETFFKGIKELRGGHYLIIKNQKLKMTRYWDLPQKVLTVSDEEATKEFNRLLHESVKLRLRSDVSIGSCLSGGLDSSAITCIINEFLKQQGIKQIGDHQKTFSAVYDDKKYPKCDEREYINVVTKKTKANSYFVFPSGKKLAKEISDLIYYQDFPFGSTSIYAQYNVFRLAGSKNIKVMLDGQGADELLAGYHTFFPIYFQSLKNSKHFWRLLREMYFYNRVHGQGIREALVRLILPVNIIKSLKNRLGLNLKNAYYNSYYDYGVFNQKWRNSFTSKSFPKPNNDVFKDQSFLLARIQGLPSLLRYEDRNSMAFSIESRTPFLDYRLVEFVYGLANNQKIRFGQTKWVMRQALKGVLPGKIRHRQDKIGFATPEEIWMKKILAKEMLEVFGSKSFLSRGYFDGHKVQESFKKYLKGEPIMYQLFWRIYNLELWLRRFID